MTEPSSQARLPGSERVLAFDFGTRSIGIASGNRITRTASPCGALRANAGRPDWAQLDPLIAEWSPAALIVGLPLNMDGTESELCVAARRFSRRVSARYHLPAFMVDERLSSRAVTELLGKASPDKARHDAAAACLILETWLQEHE